MYFCVGKTFSSREVIIRCTKIYKIITEPVKPANTKAHNRLQTQLDYANPTNIDNDLH